MSTPDRDELRLPTDEEAWGGVWVGDAEVEEEDWEGDAES